MPSWKIECRDEVPSPAKHTGRDRALCDAIANTTGKYLGIVDSDDLLAPEALWETAAVLDSAKEEGWMWIDTNLNRILA